MFEDTVLRFTDKERQQQLAEQEQALAQRRANLEVRQKNLLYRQDWLKKDPQAVSAAIQGDDRQRAEDKRLREEAKELKSRFGLKDGELIDTAAMRGALEQALAEKDVEQQMRAEQITDRASLLSGLNKLAMIDAKKTAGILHANKDLTVPREWSRQEIADMFAKAQSRVDDKGRSHTHPKTLDGWAKSLEARNRELELAGIKLDSQEQALRAQVQRAVERLGRTAEQAAAERPEEKSAPVAEKSVPAAQKVTEQAAESGDRKQGPAARLAQDATIDTSFEALNDPKRFAAAVDQAVKQSGLSREWATTTLEMLRDMKTEAQGRSADAGRIEAARNAFFDRGATPGIQRARGATVQRVTRGAAPLAQEMPTTGVQTGAQVAPRAAGVQSGTGTKATPKAAQAQAGVETPANPVAGIEGFRSLARNKAAAEQGAEASDKPTGAGKAQSTQQVHADGAAGATGAATAPRKRFKELNAHEKLERRAEFFGNLREAAGFTRDGKQVVPEKAKEATRPGKQRDGYGVG